MYIGMLIQITAQMKVGQYDFKTDFKQLNNALLSNALNMHLSRANDMMKG